MKIEVLYFAGCPNHRAALERVREVLREENIRAEVAEVNVSDAAAAEAAQFPGSPTVRVNGADVEPSARDSRDYGMMCRTYWDGARRDGAPAKELIRAAVREALRAEAAGSDGCGAPETSPAGRPGTVRRPAAFLAAAVAAAALASFCCILPIVFALTGLTVAGAAAAFSAWRPYLLGATFSLLGLGFYFAYRTAGRQCAPGSLCAAAASRRRVRATLWLAAAVVLVLAAFPYFSGPVADWLLSGRRPGAGGAGAATPVRKTSLAIEGMDCAACASAIQNKLGAAPGVRRASVSLERRTAEIEFDAGVTSVEQLVRVVEQAGYRVRNKT